MILGVVKDGSTGEPLPNTEVTLFNDEGEEVIVMLSDENGIFRLKSIGEGGPCNLVVVNKGYHYINYLFDTIDLLETPNLEINLKCRVEGTPREIYMCRAS